MDWRRWTPDEIADLHRLYPDPSVSPLVLEARFNRRIGTIKAMARLQGLRRGPAGEWTPAEEDEVRRLYPDEDIPSDEIARRLGRTWRAICHKANALGLRRPKPNTCGVVRDFFHTIDTDQKAYWLGFIAADGTVVAGPRRYQVVLDLQPGDLHWLQRFRDTIAPGASITQNGTRSFSVCVSSQELAGDLMALGVGPRKSDTLEWPRVPEAFAIPFLLGYFDGDGSLAQHIDRYGGMRWTLVGTQAFLSMARHYIQLHTGIPMREPVRQSKTRCPHLYRIHAYNKHATTLDCLLNASSLGLPRKHLPVG
ncbi:MAG: hypothetical protein OHK0022_00970 [Roseiflexaceae bacterium]